MVFEFRLVRKLLSGSIAVLLAGVGLITAAPTEVQASSLFLEGTIKKETHQVVIGKPFNLQYTLTPGGTLPAQEERDPVDIVLVLDVSGSMSEKVSKNQTRMDALKSASKTLLDELKSVRLNDRVGVISFNSRAKIEEEFSTDYDDVFRTIDRLSPDGNTNLSDGLKLANEMFMDSWSSNKKFVIALSDGFNNYYTDDRGRIYKDTSSGYGASFAKKRANTLKDKGIVIHTIALGKAGSSDVDHTLLEHIAAPTGFKFDASNASSLAAVFERIAEEISGQIGNISIKQPLPEGFALAPGNPSGVSVTGNILTIQVPSTFSYPFASDAKVSVDVKLMQISKVGSFSFEDATLHYKALNTDQTGTIDNEVVVHVGGWVDKWNNLYVGDMNGLVTRYKHGDLAKKQWSIHEKNKQVIDISFGSPDAEADDSIVKIKYEDGSMTTLNLRPTVPKIELSDADGATIAEGDTSWHKGKAKIRITGSVNQLPPSTIYYSDEFMNDRGYISEYRLQANSVDWLSVAPNAEFELNRLGANIHLKAFAVTHAISGLTQRTSSSELAERVTKLDDDGPQITISYEHNQEEPQEVNPTIKVRAEDSQSPVRSIKLEVDGAAPQTFNVSGNNAEITRLLSDFIANKELRKGWKKFKITAVNEAGLSSETSGYELMHPGLSGSLEPDIDTSVKASSTPVTVRVLYEGAGADNLIVPGLSDAVCGTCEAVTFTRMWVEVETTPWGGSPSDAVYELRGRSFKLTAEGRHKINLFLEDSLGKKYPAEPITVNIHYKQKQY